MALSWQEKRSLATIDAALVASDPRWAEQFTSVLGCTPDRWVARQRLAFSLWSVLLLVGIAVDDPLVDTAVVVALLSIPALFLLVVARRT